MSLSTILGVLLAFVQMGLAIVRADPAADDPLQHARLAYLKNGIIQLIFFSAGIVFFFHNNSARTMFFSQFS